MAESAMLSQGPSVAATLLQILEEQGDADCVEVLRAAVPSIVLVRWDGWNDQTAVYELVLGIPPVLFARLEARLEKIEARVGSKLGRLPIGGDLEQLRSARICPQLLAGPGGGVSVAPSATDADRIWGSGRLRMFLCHVSLHKIAASNIKDALSPLGIAAFVAHQDVEPSLEWQKEIEFALQSMDVLCALLTPEFHSSRWTGQELGFALGRRVPIIAVRLGADPYGFIAKIQAIAGTLTKPSEIAASVLASAMRVEGLRTRIVDSLVGALAEAASFIDARSAMKGLVPQQHLLTNGQIERLLRAARDNSQVKLAFGVADQIQAIAQKAGVKLPPQAPQSTFDDDMPI